MYTVSVEKAIRKRKRILHITLLLICVIGLPLGIIGVMAVQQTNWHIGVKTALSFLSIIAGVTIGALIAFMTDEIRTAKWQLWAFSNVRNVHELKKIADQDHLMHGTLSSLLPGREFKENWAALQYRFDTPDEDLDNAMLPDGIRIERSTWRIIKNSPLLFFFMIVPIFLIGFFQQEEERSFILLAILGLAVLSIITSLSSFLMLFDKKIFIEVNDEGIRIGREGNFPWAEIKNEQIQLLHYGSYNRRISQLYLTFDYTHIDHSKTIEIDKYKATRFELIDIIQTYRARHDRKTKRIN